MRRVAIVKGERSVKTVHKAIELIGDLSYLSGKPLLIKVNLISTRDWRTGATTDPIVVEALIQKLKKIENEIYVVESNATMTNADKAVIATGIRDVCEKYKVPFINLSKTKDKVEIKLNKYETLRKITLPEIVLKGNIVSAAKLKTHTSTKVTLGLKNMFGLIPEKYKVKYHFKDIEKVVVDIVSIVKPALTVIDGFVAMEGRGPVNGRPVPMNLIIAGKDPIATDAVAARIMGFDPLEIKHIVMAASRGIGEINNIEVVGEKIENVMRKFVIK